MPGVVRILGVDTSLRNTGVGVLDSDGMRHAVKGFGTIPCKRAWPVSQCLVHLQTEINRLIEQHKPTIASIEGIFYCKNVRTAMVLGQARGVVIACCAASGIPVYEYAPRRVKQSIVGSGRATKNQVGEMVKRMFGLNEVPQEDAADALAIAYCHANQLRYGDELKSSEMI